MELYEQGEVSIEIKEGKVEATYDGKGGDVVVKIEIDYLIDKLAAKIPGEVDDAIFAVIKGALKAL